MTSRFWQFLLKTWENRIFVSDLVARVFGDWMHKNLKQAPGVERRERRLFDKKSWRFRWD